METPITICVITVVFLMDMSIGEAIRRLTPRQLFWAIGLLYTIVFAITFTPGLLDASTAQIIRAVQNAVSVALVAYIGRTSFPNSTNNRSTDTVNATHVNEVSGQVGNLPSQSDTARKE